MKFDVNSTSSHDSETESASREDCVVEFLFQLSEYYQVCNKLIIIDNYNGSVEVRRKHSAVAMVTYLRPPPCILLISSQIYQKTEPVHIKG